MIGRRSRALAAWVSERSRALALASAERPRRVFAFWALFTVLALPGLLRLESNTDGLALLPPDDPAVHEDREIRQRFDLRDPVLVFFEAGGPEGVLEPSVLAAIERLSEEARALEGIGRHYVTSLATEPRDRLFPGTGDTFGSFVDPLPRSAEELAMLKADLDLPSSTPLEGTVISADRRRAAVLVGAPDDLLERRRLIDRLEALASELRRPGLGLVVVGAPAATALLADHILRDLALLIPIALLLVALVIARGTRSRAAVAIALAKVGLTIAWTFGVLGLLGIPIYLPVTIVPVVLAALCIADEIHLLMRYQRELARTDDARLAVERTVNAMAMPVVVATATTCVGFLSCLATGLPPIRALGLAAGLGTAYCLFFSLTMTPALFATLPSRWFARSRSHAVREQGEERLGLLGRLALARPVPTLAVLALLTLVAAWGARQVRIQDSWIDCFAEGSDFRRATERVNGALDGVHLLHLRLQLRPDAPARSLLEPGMLARIAELEAVAADAPTVGDVLGLTHQLAAVAEFWKVGDWQHDEAEARYAVSRFDFAPGEIRRRRLLTDDHRGAVLTVFLKDANFRDTATLITSLRQAEERLLTPVGIELGLAGDIATSQALIPAVVKGQMASLPLALVGVFASVFLLGGSAGLALAALVPVTLAALWLLGGLGFVGLPLGVATSMFFVISIGLGVDSHSIHLVLRAQEKWRENHPDPIRSALREVRPAILVNSLAIAAGFGLLAASTVPPNRNLGLLIAAAIVLGCGITLGGLASILELASARRSSPGASLPQSRRLPIHRSPNRNRGVFMNKAAFRRLLPLVLTTLLITGLALAPALAQSGPGETTACEDRVNEILASYAQNPPPESFGFPAYPEIEYENSLITFRICKVKANLTPEQEERRKKSWKCCDPEFYDVQLLKLDAYMRLCREVPVLNEIGFREVRFTIERWELFGRADLFGGDVVFSVTPGVIQPKSLAFATSPSVPTNCQALEGGISDSEECEDYKSPENMTAFSHNDYPAMIVYNAIYDVWLNNKTLVQAEPGIAMARGIMQIPPTGITVAFQKPVETTLPDGTIIKICPGTCSGMVTIPQHEFWAGIATADGIKDGSIRLPDDWQPEAVTRPATYP